MRVSFFVAVVFAIVLCVLLFVFSVNCQACAPSAAASCLFIMCLLRFLSVVFVACFLSLRMLCLCRFYAFASSSVAYGSYYDCVICWCVFLIRLRLLLLLHLLHILLMVMILRALCCVCF